MSRDINSVRIGENSTWRITPGTWEWATVWTHVLSVLWKCWYCRHALSEKIVWCSLQLKFPAWNRSQILCFAKLELWHNYNFCCCFVLSAIAPDLYVCKPLGVVLWSSTAESALKVNQYVLVAVLLWFTVEFPCFTTVWTWWQWVPAIFQFGELWYWGSVLPL